MRRVYKGSPAAGGADSGGDKKCAWVVLLMGGGSYEPGALVVAQSLKALKTRHDVVCMVTADVPAETRARLKESALYDAVVDVPYITQKTRPFTSSHQVEMYGGWIDHSFTKWNCLLLTQYRRVLLVDADIVAMANCDDLFELRPPAACYSNPWAEPHQPSPSAREGLLNPYLTPSRGSRGGLRWSDPLHGSRVTGDRIEMAVHTKSFVGWGAMVLLEPSAEKHAALLTMIYAAGAVFGEEYNSISGSDEVSIALLYAREGWTHIHQRYLAIPWKTDWVSCDIRAYHFHGRKPWNSAPTEWPDLAIWWGVAGRVVADHPTLRGLFYPRKLSAIEEHSPEHSPAGPNIGILAARATINGGDGSGPRGDGRGPRGDGSGPRGDGRGPRGDGSGPRGAVVARADGRGPRGGRHDDRDPRGMKKSPSVEITAPSGALIGPNNNTIPVKLGAGIACVSNTEIAGLLAALGL